jgi:hypothetical protein
VVNNCRKRARPHPNISIRIEACIRARAGNQITALETIFDQLCNLLEAPVTPVFVFDGPGVVFAELETILCGSSTI